MRARQVILASFFLLLGVGLSYGTDLRGKVVNQATGEPLHNVAVVLIDTSFAARTASDGSFQIASVPPGKYTLRVDEVGFWFHRMPVEVGDDDPKEFSIFLTPQGAARKETVEVTADVFGGAEPAAVSQEILTTSELKQTDTVFGGDLFRSVQTLPGVTGQGNNDFFSQFMVLGAPFESVGVYIDDVLVRQPFHGISDQTEGASIGVMNDDVIDTLTLVPLAFSERYGESTAAALDIRTREGSRERNTLGVGVGMAESHATAEGALPAKRGSWLISARKSYLGYLTRHAVGEGAPMEPSFSDVNVRVSYDLNPRQTLDLLAIAGTSKVDDSWQSAVDPFTFFSGGSKFTLLRTGWKNATLPNLLLSAHGAYTSQQESSRNQQGLSLVERNAAEWVGAGDIDWTWQTRQSLRGGWTLRRLTGYVTDYRCSTGDGSRCWSWYAGTGIRNGGYVQQSSSLLRDRLQLVGSARFDKFSEVAGQHVSGQLSASIAVAPSTLLIGGVGNYIQYPDEATSNGPCGWPSAMFVRSDHYLAGVEQRFGENTRIRFQAFHRKDATIWGVRPLDNGEFGSLGNPGICGPVEEPHGYSSELFTARTNGGQIVFQRRSSNRFVGWISYTYLLQTDSSRSCIPTPSSEYSCGRYHYRGWGDQRSSVNAFGSYRLRPSLSVSGKALYGSGYPGGFTSVSGEPVYVDGHLSTDSLTNTFLRFDVRVDKALTVRGQRLNVHGEILNVTDHKNIRYITPGSIVVDGQPQSAIEAARALRFTPAVGVDFQF